MKAVSLHEAVRSGDANAVFDAIKSGADLNAIDDRGHPPAWYLFADPIVDEADLEARYAVRRMLELQGAELKTEMLRDHLSVSESAARDALGLPPPVIVEGAPGEHAEGGDLGLTWRCDWTRTESGIEIWLVDRPEVRVSAKNVDDAGWALHSAIMELGDYEPNVEFVGNEPE